MKRKTNWTTAFLWLCLAAILILTGNVIRKTVMIARMAPTQLEMQKSLQIRQKRVDKGKIVTSVNFNISQIHCLLPWQEGKGA